MNILHNKKNLRLPKKCFNPRKSVSASGDGDCARCCRLCGSDNNLKHFQESYVWEGKKERYDQLLFECFGITVTPSDCMICELCVHGLRTMGKFKAVVTAAFQDDISTSNSTTVPPSSSNKTLKTSSCQTTTGKRKLKKPVINLLPKRKPLFDANNMTRKKKEVNKKWKQPEVNSKRVNVQCRLCRQRYPLLLTNGDSKPFTCARCKRNGDVRSAACKNCHMNMPSNIYRVHLDLPTRTELMAKARPLAGKAQMSPSRLPTKPKERPHNANNFKKNTTINMLTKTASNNLGVDGNDLFYILRENPEKKKKLDIHLDADPFELLYKRGHRSNDTK